jgi:heavy metal sensor kinase
MNAFHSLRWRIQIWHGAFMFAVLLGLGIAAYRYEKASGIQRVDDELRKRLAILLDSIPDREERRPPPPPEDRPFDDERRPPPDRQPFNPPRFRMPTDRAAWFDPKNQHRYYYQLWRKNSSVWASSENAPADLAPPRRALRGELNSTQRVRGKFHETYAFTPPGECVLVGGSIEPEELALRKFGYRLFAIEAAIFLLGLGGGWWVTSRALRPLKAITTTANGIADGHLDQRIAVSKNRSELGELAVSLNQTFEKLEAAFARQAQFTSDAAHELRTPLSVVISQAQLALRGTREPTEYREMFEASLRSARRMQKLTQSLLELAKLDNHANHFELQPTDLALLANETTSILELAASERQITFAGQLADAPCLADPDAIIRVILNLLANAIEHSPAGAAIEITTGTSAGNATLSVTDHGPGIAAEHLPRIFDRFYRADRSRNRKTGGTGLGLAICKTIIEAHGGSLGVTSEVGKGSRFFLTVPEK